MEDEDSSAPETFADVELWIKGKTIGQADETLRELEKKGELDDLLREWEAFANSEDAVLLNDELSEAEVAWREVGNRGKIYRIMLP